MTNHFEQLMSRAGASDQDYEVWLRERRTGLTATEAKRLAMGTDPLVLFCEKVVDARIEPNKYMEWGKISEDVVARQVADMMPGFLWEHRVFRAAGNDRHLGSPDMILPLDNGVVLGEIKSSKNDLMRPEVLERTGYVWQMQWLNYVCDADGCVLIAQRHNDNWIDIPGSMFPRPEKTYDVQFKWFARDESKISYMLGLADQYFDVVKEQGGVFV